MEEGVNILQNLKKVFSCGETDINTYSPLTLAYIGDGIYDLFIRTVVVGRGNRGTNALHKMTSALVKASAQAAMIQVLEEELTEEELAIYKRGRNAKSYTTAKNASIAEYRKATGFEALMGYLYLKDETGRAIALVKSAVDKLGMEL